MKKVLTILLALALSFSFLDFDLVTVSAETETKTQAKNNVDHCETSFYFGNLINLYVESDRHSVGAKIDLIVLTSLSSEIVDIAFLGNGFELTDNFMITGDEIHFSVTHISSNENPQLIVNVLLNNGDTLTSKLFGVVREGELYVNPYAKFLAERAYQYYTKNSEQENGLLTLNLKDSSTTILDEKSEEVSITASVPNTTVTGRILWTDKDGNHQPLRFCKIEVSRIDTLTQTIYEGYTNKNGEYYIEFTNNALDGLVNLSISVYAQGSDIEVLDRYGRVYIDSIMGNDIDELNNISTGTYSISDYIYEQGYSDDEEKTFFVEALQIAQSSICASMYYEEMKGSDVVDVYVIYPHSENRLSCFYEQEYDTIHMLSSTAVDGSGYPPYASCDVVTHEYGHHVAYHEDIDDSPGYWHEDDMSEHYVTHYNSPNMYQSCSNGCALKLGDAEFYAFTKEECKHKGCLIAWAEGYATFFGELSQQYFKSNYIDSIWQYNIPTFADEAYKSYNIPFSISMESNYEGTEGDETIIQQVLYDLYDYENHNDEDSEEFDNINLGHEGIWDCITGSGAKTLYQFVEYLKNSYYPDSQLTYIGEILVEHGLTASAPTIPSMTSDSPYVKFVWDEPNEGKYYNKRKFQVNFYDKDYNSIGSTTPQAISTDTLNVGTIAVDSQLWQTVINYPSNFYVSVTVYECNGNINNSVSNEYVTSYDSAYTMYFSPNHVHDYTHLHLKYSSSQHKSYCLCGEFVYKSHFFVAGLVNPSCRDCGYITTSIVPIIKPTAINIKIETDLNTNVYNDEEK